MNIKVMQLVNDNNNPAANQIVLFINDVLYFVSYGTNIAKYEIKTQKLTLSEKWNFSHTTSKHLYMFLRDYTKHPVYSCKDVRENIKNKVFKVVKTLDVK